MSLKYSVGRHYFLVSSVGYNNLAYRNCRASPPRGCCIHPVSNLKTYRKKTLVKELGLAIRSTSLFCSNQWPKKEEIMLWLGEEQSFVFGSLHVREVSCWDKRTGRLVFLGLSAGSGSVQAVKHRLARKRNHWSNNLCCIISGYRIMQIVGTIHSNVNALLLHLFPFVKCFPGLCIALTKHKTSHAPKDFSSILFPSTGFSFDLMVTSDTSVYQTICILILH